MKKVISLAATAAMTLSMLSVPSFVSAADSKIVDAFNIVMQDQTIVPGVTTVKVPVAFDKDVSFTVANLKFSAQVTPAGVWAAKIKNIESALPEDSGVNVQAGEKYSSTVNLSTSGRDYKIKKGVPFIYLEIELQATKEGYNPENIPEGTIFKVSLDDFDIANEKQVSYEISDDAKASARSVIFVRPEKETEGFSVKIGSDITADNTVKVPIIFNGKLNTLKTEIIASHGASVNTIDVVDKYTDDLTFSDKPGEKRLLFSHFGADDVVFNNEIVAYATVEFTGDPSTTDICFRYVDALDANGQIYPAENVSGAALRVLKGDIDLNGEVDQDDATIILAESLAQDLGGTILEDLYNNDNKDLVDKFGMEKILECGNKAGDVDDDTYVSIDDATDMLRYLLMKDLDDDFQWSDLR